MPRRCAPLDCSASRCVLRRATSCRARTCLRTTSVLLQRCSAPRARDRAGRTGRLPTETVYGLGARADDDAAVAAIFAAKGPAEGSPADRSWPGPVRQPRSRRSCRIAQRLVAAFWPGPLTIVVNRAPGMASAATGGHASIALRCPAHPVAQALLADALSSASRGSPRRAPTASGALARRPRSTCAMTSAPTCRPRRRSLRGRHRVGDRRLRGGTPVLLRPGALSRAGIEAAVGQRLLVPDRGGDARAGHPLPHYAPRAILRLLPMPELRQRSSGKRRMARRWRYIHARCRQILVARCLAGPWRAMPGDAAAAARELFTGCVTWTGPASRRSGSRNLRPPEWEGVRDRLRRAAEPDAAPRPRPWGKSLGD